MNPTLSNLKRIFATVLYLIINTTIGYCQNNHSLGIGNYGGSLSANTNPALLSSSKLRGDISYFEGYDLIGDQKQQIEISPDPFVGSGFVNRNDLKKESNWKPLRLAPYNAIFRLNKYVIFGGFAKLPYSNAIAFNYKKELFSYLKSTEFPQSTFQMYLDSNIMEVYLESFLYSYSHKVYENANHLFSIGLNYNYTTSNELVNKFNNNTLDVGFNYQYSIRNHRHTYQMDGRQMPFEDNYAYNFKIAIALQNIDFNKSNPAYKPMAIDAILDLGIGNNFYLTSHINYFPEQIRIFVSNDSFFLNNNLHNYVSIHPRFEFRFLDFGLPIVYLMGDKNQIAGIGLNFGLFNSIYLGTDDLRNLFDFDSKHQNFYGGIKLPIRYDKKSDRDNDKISDKKDVCPDHSGKENFGGCPDTDNDGIIDKYDGCIHQAGLNKFNGCPDSDKDGVMDKIDSCPKDSGTMMFKGCPDSDNDSVPDNRDICPNEKGLVNLSGCPDQDRDSVPDLLDRCPKIAGKIVFQGCPDMDRDSVPDYLDQCIETPGIVKLKGCPDKDSDGIADKDDNCPDQFGKLKGCPDGDSDGVADNDDNCSDIPGTYLLKGCPDNDKDGVADREDKCPDLAGTVFGCPDTDKDSIADQNDSCLMIAGTRKNHGCPDENLVLKTKSEFLIKSLMAKLRFERDGSIRAGSENELQAILNFLIRYKDYKLAFIYFKDIDHVRKMLNEIMIYFTVNSPIDQNQFEIKYENKPEISKKFLLKLLFEPKLLNRK